MIRAKMDKLHAFMDFLEEGGDPDDLVYEESSQQLETLIGKVGTAADFLQHHIEVPGRRICEKIEELNALFKSDLESTVSTTATAKKGLQTLQEENSRFTQDLTKLQERQATLKTHQVQLNSHLASLQAALQAPKTSMLCDFITETGARSIYRGAKVQPIPPRPLSTQERTDLHHLTLTDYRFKKA